MSWYELTSDQLDGMGPVVTQLETMLTAHAAWDFVETVTEYGDRVEPVTSADYHYQTYTCRIWKNLGSQNGTGKDFFVAIVTAMQEFRHEDTGALVYTKDSQNLWILPFEEWNTTTKMMRRPAGRDWYRVGDGSTDYFLDPAQDYAPHGNLWFKIVEPHIATDGLTWGTWGWWGRDISTAPVGNIKRDTDIWNEWYEPFLEWDYWNYGPNYALPSPYKPYILDTPDDATCTTWLRVSKQGILVWSTNADDTLNGDLFGGYAGLGNEDHRPEETKTGFPLMYSPFLWLNEYGSSTPFSRLPEFGDTVPADYFQAAQVYDFEFGVGASRLEAAYPGVTDWPVMPAKVALDPVSTYGWDSLFNDPGMIIPGVWYLSQRNGPFHIGDTIDSPEGHTCKLIPYGNISAGETTNVNWGWSIVDTELA